MWISTEDEDIKIGAVGIEDIRQCLNTLLKTIQGTVFLDRRLGISSKTIDDPLNNLSKLYKDIYEKVEYYEPRVIVEKIDVEEDHLKAIANIKILVSIKDEYI